MSNKLTPENDTVLVVCRNGLVKSEDSPSAVALLSQIGMVRRKRASWIEPVAWPLRLAFHLLRLVGGDCSRLADWTRTWPCCWQVDLRPSDGPVLGPFPLRAVAIREENLWLRLHVFGEVIRRESSAFAEPHRMV